MKRLASFAACAIIGTTALVTGLTVPPSRAQAPAKQPGGLAACRTDTATFCAGLEAGQGRRFACLMANEAKLQPACATALQARSANKEMRKAASVPPQAQATAAPLATAPGSASSSNAAGSIAAAAPAGVPPVASDRPGIQAAQPAYPAPRPMASCRTDMQALCGSIPAGGGARMRCLQDNRAKLSAPCADALAAKNADRQAEKASGAGAGAQTGACRTDALSLCRDQKGPLRRACLVTNGDKLSPDCRAALQVVAPAAVPVVPKVN